MIRILIVEDEIIIARFIERQLLTNFSCEVRIAVTVTEAKAAMAEMLPHLLLCDIHLQDDVTGIDLVASFRSRYAFEVIFITSYQARNIIEQAAATAPANYIIKPIDEAQLFAGIQLVVSRILAGANTGKAFLQPDTLFSNTELLVLRLVRERKTTQEIADALHLSRYTVKNHRHTICRKLQLRDENNALLKWVVEHGALI